jgi:hypothetical protein
MTRQEVGVEVGFDHFGDGQTIGGRVSEIFGDVALRIDDDSVPGSGVSDEVTRVREAPEVVLLEEHSASFLVDPMIPYGV